MPVNPKLLGRLLDEHGAVLVLFARQWCEAPEDAVQEAFLSLCRLRTWPEKVVPWLFTVVRNAAIDACRAENRRRNHERRSIEGESRWFIPSVGDALDAEAAVAALENLPSHQREIVVARLWGELTFEEIGEIVGCSSSTAHRHYREALALLQERLGIDDVTAA